MSYRKYKVQVWERKRDKQRRRRTERRKKRIERELAKNGILTEENKKQGGI
jgi:hypothetical protein